MTSPAEPPRPRAPSRDLDDVIDSSGDRDSSITITRSNGTVARFDMSYSPPTSSKSRFIAPLRHRAPSFFYLSLTVSFGVIVFLAYHNPMGNWLFEWLVRGDEVRPLSSPSLAWILFATGLATVLRAYMRGVIVGPDWIEARYILPLGIPSTKRWGWIQVNRIILDRRTLALELMDGAWEKLPPVADFDRMRNLFLAQAVTRKIEVTVLEEHA